MQLFEQHRYHAAMWVKFKGGNHDGREYDAPEPLKDIKKMPTVQTLTSGPLYMVGELYQLEHEPDGTPVYVYVEDYDETPA